MKAEPLKTNVLRVFAQGEAFGPEHVYELVRDRYPGERYCSLAVVEDHLKSLKAVGLLFEDGSYLDDAGELVSIYRITEYGLSRLYHRKS